MRLDVERLTHSLKTAIACSIALLLARLVGLDGDQWIVITVIVVMCAQIYVGSMLQKATLRFFGTLVGCLLAAIALLSLGDTALAIFTSVVLSSLLFSYLATSQENWSYAGTLGAVTTTIIMLGNHPTLLIAFQRFLEISVGILIAALISQYILPIHARTHLRRAQAATLEQLRDFYKITMITHTIQSDIDYQDLDENIVKGILKQRQLVKESARERGDDYDVDRVMMTLYCEREILRTIAFMHNAFLHINTLGTSLMALPELQRFHDMVLQTLETLTQAIAANPAGKIEIHLPNLEPLRLAIQQQTASYTRDQLVYVDGFLFSAEMLVDTLTKLAGLYYLPVFKI